MLLRPALVAFLLAILLVALRVSIYAESVYLPLTLRIDPPVAATPLPTVAPVCACTANLYNCADFATQSQAQACFDYCIGQGRGDIHLLDAETGWRARACRRLILHTSINLSRSPSGDGAASAPRTNRCCSC